MHAFVFGGRFSIGCSYKGRRERSTCYDIKSLTYFQKFACGTFPLVYNERIFPSRYSRSMDTLNELGIPLFEKRMTYPLNGKMFLEHV